MAAVDHAVAEGWADPERLGVTGLSYGGYMTAWIIAHTHRFKAAVYENGVSNLWSMYGTSDVGLRYFADALGATPYDDLATYVRCSPLYDGPHRRDADARHPRRAGPPLPARAGAPAVRRAPTRRMRWPSC